MNTILKNQTHQKRNFSLTVNGLVAGRVYAVYRTATQFVWDGLVKIETNKGTFLYEDAEAKSSKKFLIAAHEALNTYLVMNDAKLPTKEVLTLEQDADRSVEFLTNNENKVIPMSDLVKQIKLSKPRVTTEKLSDYDNTQSASDKVLFTD